MTIGFASEQVLQGIHVGWTERDRWRRITHVVLGGAGAALVLRIVGMPGIDLHGPLHHLGVMDPLCGGTRAAFLLMSGRFGQAAEYNPIVFPLAITAMLIVARAGIGRVTGHWLDIRLPKTAHRIVIAICVAALVALEVRQQLNAPLLMQVWQ